VVEEKTAAFYDEVYARANPYDVELDAGGWAPLWYWIDRRIAETPVVDFGCGPGHLAELLARRGYPREHYLGIDFSAEAVRQARERVPGCCFRVGELPDVVKHTRTVYRYTAVFCEVLEHIREDRRSLQLLAPGTQVLATVPMRDSEAHVRIFESMLAVTKRYEHIVEFRELVRYGRHFVFSGYRASRTERTA
jgi:trans-aconitate methyltransferase